MSDTTNETGGPGTRPPAAPPPGPGAQTPWWRTEPTPTPDESPAAGAPTPSGAAPTGPASPGPVPTEPASPGPVPGSTATGGGWRGSDPGYQHPGYQHPGSTWPGQGPAGPPPHAGGGWAGAGGWAWGPQGAGWGAGGWGQPPTPPSAGGPGKSRRPLLMAASAVLTAAAVLAGVGIGYAVWEPNVHTEPASHVSPVTPRTGTTRAGFSTTTTSTKTTTRSGSPKDDATIAAKIDPTLVDINTVLGDETAEAAGTGMVLTSTGKVLTNNHVIEGSTSISVTDLGNGETYSASVLGYDRTQDVAVIQLKGASGLKVANFGNSSTVTIGEAVVGIGNAGGTGGTPSRAGGSVTALGQAITASDEGSQTTEHLTNLIETNCDIEPGDSGGPLVNTSDQIVGMDTAASAAQGFSFSGAATGQGYSIPINTALTIAKQIEAGKSSATVHLGQTPFLGVEVESAPSTGSSTNPFGRLGFGSRTPTATPRTFGTSTTKSSTTTTPTQSATGVLVAGVLNNTAALKAGLVKGDYITAVGSTKVSSPDALTKAIEQYKVGTTVKITWTDTAGQTQTATVTFTAGPAG